MMMLHTILTPPEREDQALADAEDKLAETKNKMAMVKEKRYRLHHKKKAIRS